MDTQPDRGGIGRRTAASLGLARPVSGPRPRAARILTVGADSSNREAAAGLAFTVYVLALEIDRLLTAPTWWRLAAAAVSLLFAYNLVRVTRLLVHRRRARSSSPPGPRTGQPPR